MIKDNFVKAPSAQEKITLRIMILLGLLSFAYFLNWFLNPDLIVNQFLFWILIVSIVFESIKTIYIWYHYWDISLPEKPQDAQNFTVDVFTTYFPGEPYEMVKESLLAIQRIKYPHTSYLCDEANDEHLVEFCQSNNIIHVTRNNRINAKAGNINNALKQAKGEICLILDPDHIPFDNFLDEIIPYFQDESIGFVQTVQAYYNIKESAVAKGAAEQTFHFYGPIMMTMHSYGTVNAIGANCVFRRKALDSIGGHAAGLSEDMHTAMQLHAKGWKSIYVPKVLAKGLSPSSLTSYYKQQLKWSRGTLELLVAEYPRLFNKFTWRQKIHYGVLPSHYLSGVIYMINFLIPIVSLFTASTPWKGNMLDFGLIISPLFICIIGIRLYVQDWVMHRSERGLHITGGILQICTWWINIIGLVYTIFRKKVPYLPTPKEDKERTSWKILIPNLFVGIVSIIAVIYGLSIDFTPFSIFMSGFALLNASFMFYTLVFAYQKQKLVSFNSEQVVKKNSILSRLQNYKFRFWRKTGIPAIVIVMTLSFLIQNRIEYKKWDGVTPEIQGKHVVNYIGIFAPEIDNGITSLNNVKVVANQFGEKFDLISLYLSWNKNLDSNFPGALIDSIYIQKSIPMITWEPWLDSFKELPDSNQHVFDLIDKGYFDSFIISFSERLKMLQRPVFLRFAHEFDNPFYPWYTDSIDGPSMFKKAWIHVYQIFKDNGADNVIWIWNPWKSESVGTFYPGKEYVDWIGVNILNYGKYNQDSKWHEFENLYNPFHQEFKNLPPTPVIISEFGSLKDDQKQDVWFKNAFNSIEKEFDEIKSVIYFNSKVDDNWPVVFHLNKDLDWTLTKNYAVKSSFGNMVVPDYVFSPLPELKSKGRDIPSAKEILKNLKGINLKKGYDWRKDYHVLSRKNLLSDFEKVKRLGINTIRFEGNSIYDYNIINLAKKSNLFVSYGFWIPSDIDFIEDTIRTKLLEKSILEEISRRNNDTNIISWNLQNDVLYYQKDFFIKPRIFYQNRAYLMWLKKIVREIKEIDPSRPLIVDLEVNRQSIRHSRMIYDNIKGIDAFGLVVKNTNFLEQVIDHLKQTQMAFIYSEIDGADLEKYSILRDETPFFISALRDTHESNKLTFNGIIDRKDRVKFGYFNLLHTLQKSDIKVETPMVKILKPATPIYENLTLNYYAMYYDSLSGWKSGRENDDLSFEWSLVKCDNYGNYLAVKDIGNGARVSLKIPQDYELYLLLLTTSKGDNITQTITNLNTPLMND